ncbi:MAG: PfkB family carbohydrate kinase [Candidatus Baltobacteraceae bacterium]
MKPVVCSIGTTDPWNVAGLGLDLRALPECGARAVTVVAGVSAQDERGVRAVHAIPAATVTAQLAALQGARIAAYRIGALLDAATVRAVARHMRGADVPVVYDPVFAPSGGGQFADEGVLRAVRERLLPVVTVVTPNLSEAATLLGAPAAADAAGMAAAAQALLTFGPRAALVKGGHLRGAALDVLADRTGTQSFSGPRIAGSMRGTGCLLAAALAAALARGLALDQAVVEARAFVRRKFEHAVEAGAAMRAAY